MLTWGDSGLRLVRRGDVLSTSGEVVRSNAELLAEFQPRMFLPLGRGLDALSVTGTGNNQTIYFSTKRNFHSTKLGRKVSEGDLLTDKGELVATNEQLLEALDPRGKRSGFGLDAVAIRPVDEGNGAAEIWFSTRKGFFSQALDTAVDAGDVISNRGQLIARNADLLSAFDPKSSKSYGLDALYVMDNADGSQTFWFSTDERFFSQSLDRWIEDSELIANDGGIVMSQDEFVKIVGMPIVGCFGLDAAAMPPLPSPPKPPPIPEPATVLLLAMGALPALLRRRMVGRF